MQTCLLTDTHKHTYVQLETLSLCQTPTTATFFDSLATTPLKVIEGWEGGEGRKGWRHLYIYIYIYIAHLCLTCVSLVSHSCLTCVSLLICVSFVSHLCLACVSLVSRLCLTCVSLVSHSCLTRVSLVSHSCLTRVSIVVTLVASLVVSLLLCGSFLNQ